jgi:predicted nucleic acid-binding Zn ribbon protein
MVFELFQSMKDAPLEYCPHPEGCKHPNSKAKVTRLIGTGAGLIFKGSGFYTTDYRSSDYKKDARNDKQPSPASGGSSESSSSSSSSDKSSTSDSKPSSPSTTKKESNAA